MHARALPIAFPTSMKAMLNFWFNLTTLLMSLTKKRTNLFLNKYVGSTI